MAPKMSIIVPVYNNEKDLKRCLDSLTGQTLEDIEIIIINDGSTDSSAAIIREYQEREPKKIKLIDKENEGVSAARNDGIKAAAGEYLGFVDSDDYVDADFAELMYKAASEKDADVVICPITYETGSVVKKRFYSRTRFGRKAAEDPYILIRSNAYSPNKFVRRKYFQESGFRFENHAYEDSALWYNVLLTANRVECVNIPFYHYITTRSDSATNIVDDKIYDIFLSTDSIISFFKEHGAFEELHDTVEFLCLRHIFKRIETCHASHSGKTGRRFAEKAVNYLDENFPDWRESSFFIKEGMDPESEQYKAKKKLAYIKTHALTLKMYASGISFSFMLRDCEDLISEAYEEREITPEQRAGAVAAYADMAVHDLNNLFLRKGITTDEKPAAIRTEEDRIAFELPEKTGTEELTLAMERLGYHILERKITFGKHVQDRFHYRNLVIDISYDLPDSLVRPVESGEEEKTEFFYTRLRRKNMELPEPMLFIDTAECRIEADTLLSFADNGYDIIVITDSSDRRSSFTAHPRSKAYAYEEINEKALAEVREKIWGPYESLTYAGNLSGSVLEMVKGMDGFILANE